MADKFDPYRKWLGIPPQEQPPHHYRLLGIALFEDDTDVIASAADRQMSHVRKFQAGRNGEFSQQILNELAKARLCLLDRAQKIAYDQQLQKFLGGERRLSGVPVAPQRLASVAPMQPASPLATVATLEPYTPTAAPMAIPVGLAPAAAPQPVGARPVRTTTTRARRKASPVPLVLTLCVLALLSTLGAIVAVVASGSGEDEDIEVATPSDLSPLPSVRPQEVVRTTNSKVEHPRSERSPIDNAPRPAPRETQQPETLIIPHNSENDLSETAPSLPMISRVPRNKDDEEDADNGLGLPVGEPDPADADPSDDPLAGDLPSLDLPDKPVDDDAEDPSESNPSEPAGEEEPAVRDEELLNDPQRGDKFAAAVTATYDALASRDLKGAARQLNTARQFQQGDDEGRQVAALQEWQSHLGTFWRLVASGVRKLKAGDEIAFADDVATFDEAGDGDVALLIEGSRVSRPVEDVEPHYLVAIAERGALKPDAKSRLAIAAFLGLDAGASESDRSDEARRMLAEAIRLGGRSPALEERLRE